MNNNSEFKRLNFFTGFFTTADDWNAGEAYHLAKRRLHNRLLHRAGVMEGLDVAVDGGLKVIVEAGAALDNAGNLIYVAGPETVTLTAPNSEPTQFFITVGYHEKETDCDKNVQDPDYSGFTRITEKPSIKARETIPADHIELARVVLLPGAEQISEPEKPNEPRENELDRRHVSRAGIVDDEVEARLTAAKERIRSLYQYYQAWHRKQNQGLHNPGVLVTVLEELKVVAAGDFFIHVLPGAALDAAGNQLFLEEQWSRTIELPEDPRTIYIAARFDDKFLDYLDDFTRPFNGSFDTVFIKATTAKPNNKDWMELARIFLEPSTTEIVDHHGDEDYGPGVIDLRNRMFASSISTKPAVLPWDLQERIKVTMETTRENFALVAARFPSLAVDDVRHVALNIQMSRDILEYHQLTTRIEVLAAMEQDAEHDLGRLFPTFDQEARILRLSRSYRRPDEWVERWKQCGGFCSGCYWLQQKQHATCRRSSSRHRLPMQVLICRSRLQVTRPLSPWMPVDHKRLQGMKSCAIAGKRNSR